MTHDTLPTGAYLLCQATAKQSATQMLTEAIDAYTVRFGERPGVALLAEPVDAPGLDVRVAAHVRPGLCWLGRAE